MISQKEGAPVSQDIGSILKEIRKERKITLQQAADAVGCSPSYIHRLENKSRKNPSIKLATQLAVFYNVDLGDFTGSSGSHAELIAEISQATEAMKNGLHLLERSNADNIDEIKAQFVDVQKVLLYVHSRL